MKSTLVAASLVLALLASQALAGTGQRISASPLGASAADELRAKFDPQLESLRAGRVDESASLTAAERAVLSAAQDKSPELASMRGGGVAGLLLLALLVLVVIILI